MKNTVVKIISILIVLCGLGFIAYPIASNLLFEHTQQEIADYYDSQVSEVPADNLKQYWDEARVYNEELAASGIFPPDPFGGEGNNSAEGYYNRLLNLSGDGVMGLIEIPGVTDKLTIYHSCDEAVLQKGVGHLPGTSLPVGGESTHCVLSAHSGLSNKKLFTDLNQLENGDVFYIHVLDDTLAYKVDDIRVVLPTEVESLRIEDGKDMVTLVTCTPYGVNTHRLLVRGSRTTYEEAKSVEDAQKDKSGSTWREKYFLALLIGSLIIALGIVIIGVINRLRKARR